MFLLDSFCLSSRFGFSYHYLETGFAKNGGFPVEEEENENSLLGIHQISSSFSSSFFFF